MIPDKIYIRHYWMPGELDDDWHLKPSPDDKNEEYIRKDALLEWAKDAIQHLSDGSLTGYYESLAYQDLIDKLNSL